MMKIAIAALLMSASLVAHADDTEQLAKSKSCFACHAMAKKLVGPSFKDVAAKYKNDKGAEDKLILKILQGGSGTWGAVPMPPNQVSDAEAHQLVRWVLAQK